MRHGEPAPSEPSAGRHHPQSSSRGPAGAAALPRSGFTALAAALALSTAAGCGQGVGDAESLAESATPELTLAAASDPSVIWTASQESYPAFTVLDTENGMGSLVRDKFLGWDQAGLRLTAVPTPPSIGFTPGNVLLADGLAGASTPALSFGGFAPALGSHNGGDVAVLSFDAWFEVNGGAPATGFVELTGAGVAPGRLDGLSFPSRRFLRVSVVANRSAQRVGLPDFDDDGAIDANEMLAPNQAVAYYRLGTGAYALAAPVATIGAGAYTQLDWHLRYGNVSSVIYDDFALANNIDAQLGGHALVERMPGGVEPPRSTPPGTVVTEFEEDMEIFEPVIDPAQSVALRQGFDWSRTTPWQETSDGKPALFYAMIYLSDAEQREALEQMGVHWRPLPLFDSEMARYRGRMGVFDFAPDSLGGTWVYALLPGKVFNILRNEALAGNVVFPAILTRTVPEAAALADDGTIRYEWLGAQVANYAPEVLEDATNATDAPLVKNFWDEEEQARDSNGRAPALQTFRWHPGRRIKNAVKKVVEVVVETTQDTREFITEEVAGSVWPSAKLTMDLTMYNSEPVYEGRTKAVFDRTKPMVRAWEPEIGTPLTLPGIQVEVNQGIIGLSRVRLDKQGHASVDVLKRLRLDLCLVLENHAAELTTAVIETRVCDFSGAHLGKLTEDKDVALHVREGFSTVMAQLTDGYEYMQRVENKKMHKAQVLVGGLANKLSKGASYAPWALLCLRA